MSNIRGGARIEGARGVPGDATPSTNGGTKPSSGLEHFLEHFGELVRTKPLGWTVIWCMFFGTAGQVTLWLAQALGWNKIFWQPVAGIVLILVSIGSFGGFYLASRRARVAITASFLLTFLVAFAYGLTVKGFAQAGQGNLLAQNFHGIVWSIIAFYFGSEAVTATAKVIASSRAEGSTAKDVRQADSDLVLPPREAPPVAETETRSNRAGEKDASRATG